MKYYRLNKDWLPFAKGTKFLKTEDGGDMYTLEDNTGVLARIPTDLLDEINDSDHWKPMNGEKFYYIDEDGDVFDSIFGPSESPLDMDVYLLGNCFRTREDAQAVVDWLRARQRLIKSGARFINLTNADSNSSYYRVVFDKTDDRLRIVGVTMYDTVVYEKMLVFSECSLAEQSIKEHKDDWLTYLGVKEKNDED